MTKRIVLAMTLALCAVLLCACQSEEPEHFQVLNSVPTQKPVVNQAPSAPVTEPDNTTVNYDDGSYDPTAEEGRLDTIPDLEAIINGTAATDVPVEITMAPTVNSVYAGASPVVIDPIDKPTPSPVPPMSFTAFSTYDATKLGLSFQAPSGWVEDTSATGAYTITNPDAAVAFKGFLSISVESVSTNYSKNQMTNQVKTLLTSIRSEYNGSGWSPTKTASRDLLDADGIYADYSVTLSDGVKVRGRVQVACLNKKLYIVHMAAPAEYYETYKTGVYNKMRSTIAITK